MDRKPASGVALGVLLGLGNVLVISIGLSGLDPHNRIEMTAFVFMFGALPGLVIGALLGWVAEVMAKHPVWLRRAVLVAPAWMAVAILGSMFELWSAVFVSCIPTTAAAMWLERVTRRAEAPPVPVVAVRRQG